MEILVLNQLEKTMNETMDSLKKTLKRLNEVRMEENKNLENSNKYDEEMTEEEKKIYEEEGYVKVGEPLPNSCLRSYTSGDWVRKWLEPYQRRQIIDVFYPLVDYILKDECAERPRFNQYNRYKIYDSLRDITSYMLNKPLKDDEETRRRLAETLIKIYPKNRKIFWETIVKIKEVFSVDMKKEKDLDNFLKNKYEVLTKKLLDIKNKHEDHLIKVMGSYREDASPLYFLLNDIELAFNKINTNTLDEDDVSSMISEIDKLIGYDRNEENKKALRNFMLDLEKVIVK